MNKSVIICADDYGLNPGISQGIRQLIKAGKLQATSCMVNYPNWQAEAQALLALNKAVQIGLHFNLTEGYSLFEPAKKFISLPRLILASYTRLLSAKTVQAEWQAQLAAFVQAIGRLPDFVDGHQHVHQLPTVRSVLLNWYQQLPAGTKPWLRVTTPAIVLPEFKAKNRLLAVLGGRTWQRQLQDRHIAHNPCFAGVYDFSPRHDYQALLSAWLNEAPAGTVLMCHPGLPDPAPDGIASARAREFAVLSELTPP